MQVVRPANRDRAAFVTSPKDSGLKISTWCLVIKHAFHYEANGIRMKLKKDLLFIFYLMKSINSRLINNLILLKAKQLCGLNKLIQFIFV